MSILTVITDLTACSSDCQQHCRVSSETFCNEAIGLRLPTSFLIPSTNETLVSPFGQVLGAEANERCSPFGQAFGKEASTLRVSPPQGVRFRSGSQQGMVGWYLASDG